MAQPTGQRGIGFVSIGDSIDLAGGGPGNFGNFGPGAVTANVPGLPNGMQNDKRTTCHASSAESGFAKALGFGSNAQDAATSAAKLAAREYADAIDKSLGLVGLVLSVAGEAAQAADEVAHGTRLDVALVGASARIASPIVGAAVGAALGAADGFGFGAVPGSIGGLVVGAASARKLGRLAEADMRRVVGCQ